MRFAIYGSGGVGGYFGARLADAGEDVTFIARGDHLAAIQRDGLTVKSINGDLHLDKAQASDDPATIGVVDVVIVAVKAWQVEEIAKTMAPLIGPATLVLPLENGVEATDVLGDAVGHDKVLRGLCGILAYREAPGVIRHAGVEPFVRFGEADNRQSERTRRVKAAFDKAAGVTAEIPDDIQVAVWSKFLFICAMSGVGAVTRAPMGVSRQLAESRRLLEEVMEEITAVGRARGVALPDDAVAKALKFIDTLPENSTASMQRDIMDGLPSELESQNGAVVRLGKAAGVATPINAALYAALLPQEARARGQVAFDDR